MSYDDVRKKLISEKNTFLPLRECWGVLKPFKEPKIYPFDCEKCKMKMCIYCLIYCHKECDSYKEQYFKHFNKDMNYQEISEMRKFLHKKIQDTENNNRLVTCPCNDSNHSKTPDEDKNVVNKQSNENQENSKKSIFELSRKYDSNFLEFESIFEKEDKNFIFVKDENNKIEVITEILNKFSDQTIEKKKFLFSLILNIVNDFNLNQDILIKIIDEFVNFKLEFIRRKEYQNDNYDHQVCCFLSTCVDKLFYIINLKTMTNTYENCNDEKVSISKKINIIKYMELMNFDWPNNKYKFLITLTNKNYFNNEYIFLIEKKKYLKNLDNNNQNSKNNKPNNEEINKENYLLKKLKNILNIESSENIKNIDSLNKKIINWTNFVLLKFRGSDKKIKFKEKEFIDYISLFLFDDQLLTFFAYNFKIDKIIQNIKSYDCSSIEFIYNLLEKLIYNAEKINNNLQKKSNNFCIEMNHNHFLQYLTYFLNDEFLKNEIDEKLFHYILNIFSKLFRIGNFSLIPIRNKIIEKFRSYKFESLYLENKEADNKSEGINKSNISSNSENVNLDNVSENKRLIKFIKSEPRNDNNSKIKNEYDIILNKRINGCLYSLLELLSEIEFIDLYNLRFLLEFVENNLSCIKSFLESNEIDNNQKLIIIKFIKNFISLEIINSENSKENKKSKEIMKFINDKNFEKFLFERNDEIEVIKLYLKLFTNLLEIFSNFMKKIPHGECFNNKSPIFKEIKCCFEKIIEVFYIQSEKLIVKFYELLCEVAFIFFKNIIKMDKEKISEFEKIKPEKILKFTFERYKDLNFDKQFSLENKNINLYVQKLSEKNSPLNNTFYLEPFQEIYSIPKTSDLKENDSNKIDKNIREKRKDLIENNLKDVVESLLHFNNTKTIFSFFNYFTENFDNYVNSNYDAKYKKNCVLCFEIVNNLLSKDLKKTQETLNNYFNKNENLDKFFRNIFKFLKINIYIYIKSSFNDTTLRLVNNFDLLFCVLDFLLKLKEGFCTYFVKIIFKNFSKNEKSSEKSIFSVVCYYLKKITDILEKTISVKTTFECERLIVIFYCISKLIKEYLENVSKSNDDNSINYENVVKNIKSYVSIKILFIKNLDKNSELMILKSQILSIFTTISTEFDLNSGKEFILFLSENFSPTKIWEQISTNIISVAEKILDESKNELNKNQIKKNNILKNQDENQGDENQNKINILFIDDNFIDNYTSIYHERELKIAIEFYKFLFYWKGKECFIKLEDQTYDNILNHFKKFRNDEGNKNEENKGNNETNIKQNDPNEENKDEKESLKESNLKIDNNYNVNEKDSKLEIKSNDGELNEEKIQNQMTLERNKTLKNVNEKIFYQEIRIKIKKEINKKSNIESQKEHNKLKDLEPLRKEISKILKNRIFSNDLKEDKNNKTYSNVNKEEIDYKIIKKIMIAEQDLLIMNFLNKIVKRIEICFGDDKEKRMICFLNPPTSFRLSEKTIFKFFEYVDRESRDSKIENFMRKIDEFLFEIHCNYRKKELDKKKEKNYFNRSAMVGIIYFLVFLNQILMVSAFYESPRFKDDETDVSKPVYSFDQKLSVVASVKAVSYTQLLLSIQFFLYWLSNNFMLELKRNYFTYYDFIITRFTNPPSNSIEIYKEIQKNLKKAENLLVQDQIENIDNENNLILDKNVTDSSCSYLRQCIDYLLDYMRKIKKNFHLLNVAIIQTIFLNNQVDIIICSIILNLIYVLTDYSWILTLQVFFYCSIYPLLFYILVAAAKRAKQLFSVLIFTYMVIYIFTWVAFYHLPQMFNMSDVLNSEFKPVKDNLCTTLPECYMNMIDFGTRSGGGIGDIWAKLSYKTNFKLFFIKFIFVIFFHMIIVMILGNIFMGIILDAFADLRDKNDLTEFDKDYICFICNISKGQSLSNGIDFEEHRNEDHYIFNYLYFINYLLDKKPDDYDHIEDFSIQSIARKNSQWIPKR